MRESEWGGYEGFHFQDDWFGLLKSMHSPKFWNGKLLKDQFIYIKWETGIDMS